MKRKFHEKIATNKTPIWDSEQKKFVAEEDKEEKETASLSEEINMMKSETLKPKELNITDNSDDDDDDDTTSFSLESDDDDELPF